MKRAVVILAAVAFLGSLTAAPASADEWVFGFSGGLGSGNNLTVTTASTGVFTLFTDDAPLFTAGVSNQGWWSPINFNSDTNDNYIAGFDSSPSLWNNFFTFSVGGLDPMDPVVRSCKEITSPFQ